MSTDPQMLELQVRDLEMQLAAARLAYEELCKDVAEWHPVADCAGELHTTRSLLSRMVPALLDAKYVLDKLAVSEDVSPAAAKKTLERVDAALACQFIDISGERELWL